MRAVLVDLYNQGVAHHQHSALLKQDVCVAKVTSWTVAESMKGAPGIFEDNDPEQTKKLKETLTQSDSLLKLGIGGSVYMGDRREVEGAGGVAPKRALERAAEESLEARMPHTSGVSTAGRRFFSF